MAEQLANFKEESSAKIPALALLSSLGYTFIPPSECEQLRGKLNGGNKTTGQVMLLPMMRAFLAKQTFPLTGKQHPLSAASVDKIMHELNPAMNEGLKGANKKLYNAMMYGVSVTEFVDGKKASPTIQLIDWHTITNNQFHFTEEMVIQNSEGTGNRIPDIVCFVNGLPWVVIEAKRPASSKEGKPTIDEGISQNIRNQGQVEIPHLFAYSQLLLSINGNKGLYATCGTPKKFWAKWKEEEIIEAEMVRLKNKALDKSGLVHRFGH